MYLYLSFSIILQITQFFFGFPYIWISFVVFLIGFLSKNLHKIMMNRFYDVKNVHIT